MLEDPPGARPKRPSLAPSLSTRISEIPRAPTTPPPAKGGSKWALGGGVLGALALLVLLVGRAFAPAEETLPVLNVSTPVPVPDPEPAPTPSVTPEPMPVPDPAPAPPPLEAAPPVQASAEPESEEGGQELAPEHLAVIVHPSNPLDSLTREDIRRIYLEDRSWPNDGGVARPVGRYLAPALRKVFLELVLGTNHQAIKEHWEAKKAEGLERVRRLPSNEAVVQYVARRPDAIGYVDWAQLDAEQREQVKLVFEIKLR